MKVGINGFGRIGRLVFRIMESEFKDLEVVAINDLTEAGDLAYLLKYDTNHRNYKVNDITSDENNLIVDGRKIKIYKEMNPENLPWGELGIDIVFECTGHFTSLDKARSHIKAGARHVIVSAPCKGDVKTIVYNVNHHDLDGTEEVISAASCTTNCLAPVLDILEKNIGIESGYMTTVHAYTNDQVTLDVAHPKGIMSRRGRACAANIVPTSTGAASAIGAVIPSLKGKMQGIALRVPVSDGSVVDLVLKLKKKVTKEELNNLISSNQNETIMITNDPIVSSDVIGSNYGSVVDSLSTDVLDTEDGQLVKIISWYDNEMGYSYQMVRTASFLASKSK
ncbi:MAG: type I glyceraldehyde-3-phosphate dehydrogenase [Bacilli bacterium]|nr:type I glyceraldehyde-3-phosphate dehydrogenase [Bacilli bacterium]